MPGEFKGKSMTTDPVVYEKKFVRNNYLRKRIALTEEDVEAGSDQVCAQLRRLDAVQDASRFVFYYPFQNEIDLLPLAEELLGEGRQIFFPKYLPDQKKYVLARIQDLENDFVPGKYGIPEPIEYTEFYEPKDLKNPVWFVPGVAFDHEGNRLGRGGGYYDRFLTGMYGFFIAVAYHWQLLDKVPHERHDAKVDALATDQELLIFIEKDFE